MFSSHRWSPFPRGPPRRSITPDGLEPFPGITARTAFVKRLAAAASRCRGAGPRYNSGMAQDAPGALEVLGPSPSPETALATLAGPVRRWFERRFGPPTPAQRLAWPALAAGKNLLVCAPTGSGKTLAGFLPVISALFTAPVGGAVRCLYVTPLKALGND